MKTARRGAGTVGGGPARSARVKSEASMKRETAPSTVPPRRDRPDSELDPARELRARGLRVTGPRLAILAHLRSDLSHPSPEAVHAALQPRHPSLSLSTVYQTLEAFLQAGLCRRVTTGSNRLRVDGTTDDHDHAVCRSCGAVMDLARTPAFRPPRPPALPRGTELIGFRIEYEVVCARCGRNVASGASGD